MNKHFFKNLLYVIPLLIVIPVMMLIQSMVGYFEDTVYNSIFQERVNEVKIFADRADMMLSSAATSEEYKEVYRTATIMQIEEMDKHYGTFAIAMDRNLDIISRRFYDDEQDGDPMNIPTFRNAIYEAIVKAPKGFIEVEWKEVEHTLYYQSIPLHDTEYWVVVSVGKDRIVEELGTQRLTIPLFIVGFVLILAVEDSVFLRLKQGKKEIKSKK